MDEHFECVRIEGWRAWLMVRRAACHARCISTLLHIEPDDAGCGHEDEEQRQMVSPWRQEILGRQHARRREDECEQENDQRDDRCDG